MEAIPPWVSNLADEDLVFVKRFILASGSLKAVAGEYGVSYPTIRLRLNRIVEKIKASDQEADPYVLLIKQLALNGGVDMESARVLISAYRKEREK